MSKEHRPIGKGQWGPLPRNKVIRVALGNVSAFDLFLSNTLDGRLLVAITNGAPFGAYVFQFHAYGSYVAEKLGVPLSDGKHLADLINEQLGATVDEPQGTYDEQESHS